MLNIHDITRDQFMFRGPLAGKGYDWCWHSFTCNPALGAPEPVFGQKGGGRKMAGKLGAAVVSCRRGGASATFEQLNQYFTISNMPIVSSQYWNSVHGFTPEDVRKDKEGLQTMRTLGENMAWLLKCIEAGRKSGVDKTNISRYEVRHP